MFYEKNRAVLAARPEAEALLKRLDAATAATQACLLETPEGVPALQYQHLFLNDSQAPLTEVKHQVALQTVSGVQGTWVVFGLELGYLPSVLLNASKGPLYIYEPDLRLLRFLLEALDYSDLLSAGRVFLFDDLEEMLRHLRRHYIATTSLTNVVLPGYQILYPQELSTLKDQLADIVERAVLDIEIVKVQHAGWIETFFKNMHHLASALPMNDLQNRFLQKPALVISGGPSLDDAMEDIRKVQDQMVILAVGRALRTLLEAGIVPDFTLFADYVGIEAQVCDLPETVRGTQFILPAFGDPHCFEIPTQRTFVMLGDNMEYIADWLDGALQATYLRLPQIAPVSIAALESAFLLGCDPIVLIGQDLAYRGTQIYAGDIHTTIDEAAGVSILEGSKTLGPNYATLSQILGQDGSLLHTNVDYVMFARQLEERAALNAQSPQPRRLINASMGGAYLKGFQHQSLSEFMRQQPLPVLDKAFTHLPPVGPDPDKGYALMLGLSQFSQAITQTKLAAEELLKAAALLEGLDVVDWKPYLENYQAKRQHFAQLVKRYPLIMPFIYDQLIEHRLEETDEQSPQHKLAWIQRYHTAVCKGLEKLLPWVMGAEERLQDYLSERV